MTLIDRDDQFIVVRFFGSDLVRGYIAREGPSSSKRDSALSRSYIKLLNELLSI